jgi:hypothetical protein
MAKSADHHDDLALHRLVKKRIIHPETLCDWLEPIAQGLQAPAFLGHKTGAHEKAARGNIVELRRVTDVAALIGELAGNGGYDPACRWTLNTKGKA